MPLRLKHYPVDQKKGAYNYNPQMNNGRLPTLTHGAEMCSVTGFRATTDEWRCAGEAKVKEMTKVGFLASVLAFLGTSGLAQTGVVRGAYAGCLTEQMLSEFITAAVNNDTRQINALLGNGCYNIDGREYSIVSRGFSRAQVRIYAGGSSIVLWTVREAVQR